MTRQLRAGWEPEKRRSVPSERAKTGSQKSDPTIDTRFEETDIDPADFFDPEEFGIRRQPSRWKPEEIKRDNEAWLGWYKTLFGKNPPNPPTP